MPKRVLRGPSPRLAPTSIPGWTVSGTVNVLPYNLTGLLQSTDPAPADHLFQYFTGGPNNGAGGTLTQDIDVSSLAGIISGGSIKFTAAAFLGSVKGAGLAPPAQMAVAFKNSSGQTFNTVTLGPLGYASNGTSLQQQIGLVPPGTHRAVTRLPSPLQDTVSTQPSAHPEPQTACPWSSRPWEQIQAPCWVPIWSSILEQKQPAESRSLHPLPPFQHGPPPMAPRLRPMEEQDGFQQRIPVPQIAE